MASLVFEKIRSALRRPGPAGPAEGAVEATFPLVRDVDAPGGLPRRIAELSADVERLATAHAAIESRLDALSDQHELFGDALRDADGSRSTTANELRQAIARLQARVTAIGLDRETIDASIGRLDEAHGALREAQNRADQRIDELAAARRQDAAAQQGFAASLREAKDAAKRSAEQAAEVREGLTFREGEQLRSLASRIAIAHLISFVALVAVLATMAYVVWRG